MTAHRSKASMKQGWTLVAANLGLLRVAAVVLITMTMGSLLYLSLLISPSGLLRSMLLCKVQFGEYSSQIPPHHSMLSTLQLSNRARKLESEYSTHDRTTTATQSHGPSTEEPFTSPVAAAAAAARRHGTRADPTRRSTTVTVPDQCCSCEPDFVNAHHDLSTDSESQLKERIEEPREPKFESSSKAQLELERSTVQETRVSLPKFRILVGVLTMASKVERRNLLRLAYAGQSSQDADVSVRFVMGALGGVDQEEDYNFKVTKTLVGMENATYGDIIVLNCTENLNEGKTFAYFSSLPGMGVEYDYVMKTDDDSYIRFDNLARSLKPLSRRDLYYGYVLPCENEDAYSYYMAGMGYLISWDLVLWIRDSPIARNKSVGTEDQLVGDWFNEGGVAKHRVSKKPFFYDHLEFGGQCAHELVPETILVHQVKTPERWADVLGFFEKNRISSALSLPLSRSRD